MKNKLCVLLVLALITTIFSACDKAEQENVLIIPVESVQNIMPPVVAPEIPSADAEPVVPPSGETIETSVESSPPEDVNVGPQLSGDVVDIVLSNKPAAEGEFGSNADFSGIYAITNYSSINFNGQRSLVFALKGVDNNNSGSFDASATTIPDHIVNFDDFVYLNLVFDDIGLVSWNIIDRVSLIDMGQATEGALREQLALERRYEEVAAGELPSLILLSQYELGKIYAFDLPSNAEEGFSPPDIINDSDKPVLTVFTKVGEDDEFEREWKCNPYIRKYSLIFSSGDSSDKFYMIAVESNKSIALNEVDYLNLSTCSVGAEIDFDFEDYLYNDTDKVFTLSCHGNTYIINPGELVECSWMNDVSVVSIE